VPFRRSDALSLGTPPGGFSLFGESLSVSL
jgi:hypothetical protein